MQPGDTITAVGLHGEWRIDAVPSDDLVVAKRDGQTRRVLVSQIKTVTLGAVADGAAATHGPAKISPGLAVEMAWAAPSGCTLSTLDYWSIPRYFR